MASDASFRSGRGPLAWAGAVAALAVAAGACGDTPRVIPTRNFDRPTSMAWVCMAAVPPENPTALSGRPLSYCHPSGEPAPKPDFAARRFGTFGLLTNTARGEVAAVDFDRNTIVDLDPASPSYNMAPTGRFPEVIAASPDGCRAVTVNRGSCDLTMFETGRLFTSAFDQLRSSADVPAPVDAGDGVDAGAAPATATPVAGTTLVVTTRSGTILSRPGELAFLPQAAAAAQGNENLCAGDGAVVPGGAGRVPWTVVVTYPSCGLVALVSLPDGRLIDSVRVTGAGVVAAGDDPVCPVECGVGFNAPSDGGEPVLAGAPDAAAADPIAATRSVLVSALSVLPNGRRLFVAGPNADFVTAIDIVGDTPADADGARKVVALVPEFSPRGLRGLATGGRIALAEGAVGVTRLRLSVDAFAPSDGGLGVFTGRRGQFLYAIALDGSMRVISLAADQSGATADVECDANVDTLAIESLPGGRSAGCHPVSSDPAVPGPPRRLFSRGPGIRSPLITGDSNGLVPVPVDVTFSRLSDRDAIEQAVATDGNAILESVGYVLFSNGDTRLLNVDPLAASAITHVFRNRLAGVGTSNDDNGPPAMKINPSVVTTTNEVPFSLRSGLTRELLPRVEGVPLPVASGEAPAFAYAHFPRPEQTAPRTWRVTWEGVLPDTARGSGGFAPPGVAVADGAGRDLLDAGADFCRSGVLPGDLLQLRGCQETIECGDPAKFICLHTRAAAAGLCVAKEREAALAATCDRLIGSRRRYRVLSSGRTRLQLGLSLDELVRPRAGGCVADADCRPANAPAFAKFQCRVVEPGQAARCVQPCGAPVANDADCRPGFVCEDAGSALGPLCVEAPALRPDDDECLRNNGNYYVRVGKSFFVEGDSIPSFTTARADAAGVCQADTTRDARLSNRLPLSAPDCATPFAGAAAALLAAPGVVPDPATPAARWPNPCLFSGSNADESALAPTGDHVKALFETSELRFVLTNLEQLWGDGLDIDFSTRGGYFPEEIALNPGVRVAVPTQILASPIPAKLGTNDVQSLFFPYVFIVDSGRLGPGGNRGQILRINTRRAAFDSANTTDLFQIQ